MQGIDRSAAIRRQRRKTGHRCPVPRRMLDLFVQHGSYLGIILFLILTGCGLPVPEEVPIIMSGVLSAQGAMQPALALVACIGGALAGDCVMYAIGYHFGHNLLRDHPRFARFLKADRETSIRTAHRPTWSEGAAGRTIHGRRSLTPLSLGRGIANSLEAISGDGPVVRDGCRRISFSASLTCLEKPVVRWVRGIEIGATLLVASVGLAGGLWLLWRRYQRSQHAAQSGETRSVFHSSKRSTV